MTKITRIVVVGGANMDVLGRSHTPLSIGDSNPGDVHVCPGGVARNVAENLARLGVDACLVSVVGADAFGDQVLRATVAAGVDVSAVAQVAGARTGVYLSVHGPQGGLAHGINHMGALDLLTPAVLATHLPLLQNADIVVVDCNLSTESLAWLLGSRRDQPVFVDAVSAAKCLRVKPWLARVHTLKLNAQEAQALLGIAAPESGEQARWFWARSVLAQMQSLGVANVVLSLGPHGAAWRDAAGNIGLCDARAVEVVNTTGAGDALLAGLAVAHIRRMPLAEAVPWALRCAEIVLQSSAANAADLSLERVNSLYAEDANQGAETSR